METSCSAMDTRIVHFCVSTQEASIPSFARGGQFQRANNAPVFSLTFKFLSLVQFVLGLFCLRGGCRGVFLLFFFNLC